MYRVIMRDFPDIAPHLVMLIPQVMEDTREITGYVPKLNIPAMKRLGLDNKNNFYDTIGIPEKYVRVEIEHLDVFLGDCATTERNIRQGLLLEWLRKNEDYVKLMLL
jgi:hypothetical protein